jgi:hypothetical protein
MNFSRKTEKQEKAGERIACSLTTDSPLFSPARIKLDAPATCASDFCFPAFLLPHPRS